LPAQSYKNWNGANLLDKYPQVATVLAEWAEGEIKKTPNVRLLHEEHPGLARFLPQKDFGAISGAELLKQRPDVAAEIASNVKKEIGKLPSQEEKWGMIALVGLNGPLESLDDKVRSPFIPFGISGIMVAAAAVFFSYIGFDSISTHAEEAKKPQRDVPIGIVSSLVMCTVLYFGVAAIITSMEPYPIIDPDAAVAAAFRRLSERHDSAALRLSAGLIAAGALAGITSVILITLLSQARIFLAMARDGLLPPRIFGAVHPRFRTPHLSTLLTGGILCVVTALTPIDALFNMVNIGTLLAFTIVCAAVLLLRIRRPEAERPFRCPALFLVAPAGMLVNLTMMMFLPLATWLRLIGWLVLGIIIYFCYGRYHSALGRRLAVTGQLE